MDFLIGKFRSPGQFDFDVKIKTKMMRQSVIKTQMQIKTEKKSQLIVKTL